MPSGTDPNRPKVSVIVGTRPEAIKLAPVVLGLEARADIDVELCLTAQHREMVDQVVADFSLRPAHDLDLMRPGQSLGAFAARALEGLDGYLDESRPDLVLIQGDTTTVFAAALAAFYHRIPVGHVEAGLRTWNLDSPWPEEANRVLTSRLTRLHFAPTERSRQNLLDEGIPDDHIHVTGNTVIDALLLAARKVEEHPPPVPAELEELIGGRDRHRKMVLITGHRRESFGAGFEAICRAIADLAERFPDVAFVYPVHPNPNVREPVNRILDRKLHPNVILWEPVPYLPFVALMQRSTLILTDSGGIQEEAPSLGKPVLVMRETTERPEAIEVGTAKLVGTDRAMIVETVAGLLEDRSKFDAMAQQHNPYGDGRSAERVVECCADFLSGPRSGTDRNMPRDSEGWRQHSPTTLR